MSLFKYLGYTILWKLSLIRRECWYILDLVNQLLLKDWRKPSLKYIEYTILWKWSPIRRGKVSADTSTKVCEWQNGKREIEPFIFSIRHGVFSIYILGTNVATNEYSYSWRFNQAINRKMSPSCTLGFSSLFFPHDRVAEWKLICLHEETLRTDRLKGLWPKLAACALQSSCEFQFPRLQSTSTNVNNCHQYKVKLMAVTFQNFLSPLLAYFYFFFAVCKVYRTKLITTPWHPVKRSCLQFLSDVLFQEAIVGRNYFLSVSRTAPYLPF